MDPLMLDGNAVAGLLREIFATEMTTSIGTCNACGASEPLGAVHAFRGAGVVLRCPHCANTLVAIVKSDVRVWVTFPGVRALQIEV